MRSTVDLLFIVLLAVSSTTALPRVIRIGGLFSPDQLEQQLVFHAAIEKINANFNNHTIFESVVEHVDKYDSFMAHFKTCDLLRNGPVAIVGPFNEISSIQVQSICEHLEIPHLEARLMLDFRPRSDLSIHLYPHLSTFSRVYLDLLKTWGWKQFAVIYEESESVVHFKDFYAKAQKNGWDMKMFQLQPDQSYRSILWKVKDSQLTNVLLDVKSEHIIEVLRQAQQVGILSEKHNYLITSMDLHTLDLENFRHSKTNITSLRIVKEDHPLLKSLLADWQSYAARFMPRQHVPKPFHLKSKSAMIFDGIQILAQALSDLDQFEVREINCDDALPWQYGATIINYVRQVQLEGLTGFVAFDDTGFRSKLSFDILSTMDTDFEVIGTWKEGAIYKNENFDKHSPTEENYDLIRVTTVMNDPFVMMAKDSKPLFGNDRYEGYVPDLMTEISKLMNFRFEINLVKDTSYGSMDPVTKEWDGMIGEVLRGEADIAVADLTINSNREQAVDFTHPFMATGITILYKRPTIKETSLWSFLSPFSTIVWIYLLTAFAGISLILFYIGRFTPYEWTNPNPCPHHEPILENNLTTRNSFWCTIGSLMQQGSDVAPKALSTRIICAIWYFFTLIIVSSYTANLAAFLTVEKVTFPFENVEGLAAQTKIKYGCLANGSTQKFFKANSKIDMYKKISDTLSKNPSWLTKKNSDGRDRVESEDGKYAFFMESATIEYITERYCNLTQIGGLLDNKGYGIATKKGSHLRGPLSEAVLKLQELGVLQQLKDRWWKQKGGGMCIAKPSPAMTELGLKNLGGVFLVLVVGSLFAILLGMFEFFVKTKISTADKSSFKDDLWEDFIFALSCWNSTKVLKRKSSKSLSGSKVSDNRITPTADSNAFPMTTYYQ